MKYKGYEILTAEEMQASCDNCHATFYSECYEREMSRSLACALFTNQATLEKIELVKEEDAKSDDQNSD